MIQVLLNQLKAIEDNPPLWDAGAGDQSKEFDRWKQWSARMRMLHELKQLLLQANKPSA